MKRENYKEFNIYFYNDEELNLGKMIIDKHYSIVRILKDTKRNYVAIIEIMGKKYVLKEPRNEFRIPQRKIMSFFKAGEVVTTLKNITELIEKNKIKEFVKPLVAINQRKNGMIVYSSLIMEFFDGTIEIKNNDKLVKLVEKLHDNGVYHGDFNPGNFLSKGNEIKIIDTQGKKFWMGKYRAHYDMLTMKIDSYEEMEYPYSRDLWYYLALFIKKFKKLKIVEVVKKKKKELRDKGWKI